MRTQGGEHALFANAYAAQNAVQHGRKHWTVSQWIPELQNAPSGAQRPRIFRDFTATLLWAGLETGERLKPCGQDVWSDRLLSTWALTRAGGNDALRCSVLLWLRSGLQRGGSSRAGIHGGVLHQPHLPMPGVERTVSIDRREFSHSPPGMRGVRPACHQHGARAGAMALASCVRLRAPFKVSVIRNMSSCSYVKLGATVYLIT